MVGACAIEAVVEWVESFLVELTKTISRTPIPNPMPIIHLPVETSGELPIFSATGWDEMTSEAEASISNPDVDLTAGVSLSAWATTGAESPKGLLVSTSETSVERPEKPVALPIFSSFDVADPIVCVKV